MIRVVLRVHPGARADEVRVLPDGQLDVRVRARAVDGQANAAVVETLAAAARLDRRQVRLIRGERSRQKLAAVDLASLGELVQRLKQPARRGA